MWRVLIFTFAWFSQDFFSLIWLFQFFKPNAPSSLFNEPETFKLWCCGVSENFGRLAGDGHTAIGLPYPIPISLSSLRWGNHAEWWSLDWAMSRWSVAAILFMRGDKPHSVGKPDAIGWKLYKTQKERQGGVKILRSGLVGPVSLRGMLIDLPTTIFLLPSCGGEDFFQWREVYVSPRNGWLTRHLVSIINNPVSNNDKAASN